MKISTPGGKKQDAVFILPRFVSDSIVDLQDQKQNLDEKKRAGQDKIVSVRTIVFPVVIFVVICLVIFLIGLVACGVMDSMDKYNNIVEAFNSLNENQQFLHKNQLIFNETMFQHDQFITDLANDIQTLKDSVKHIEEEIHTSYVMISE